jgi:micrococcal nuclease
MPFTFLCLAAIAIDGDTLRCSNILDANGRVRLARIDAPEMAGHCRAGRDCVQGDPVAAKAALSKLLVGPVRCEVVDALPGQRGFQERDRYGRIVARCSAGGRDLGQAMIAAGHAVKWPR